MFAMFPWKQRLCGCDAGACSSSRSGLQRKRACTCSGDMTTSIHGRRWLLGAPSTHPLLETSSLSILGWALAR
eukprot:11063115-Karenia_brevis.AAC.1